MPRTFLISEAKLKFERGDRDGYLFDTNVWLHINPALPPTAPRDQQSARIYTRLYKAILMSRQMIGQCDVVMAEYINRFIRDLKNARGHRADDYKVFRRTAVYQSIVSGLNGEISETMGACKMRGWVQPEIAVSEAISSLVSGDFDFNDYVLCQFCQANNLMLVTDDADFAKLNIDIITANEALVRSRGGQPFG